MLMQQVRAVITVNQEMKDNRHTHTHTHTHTRMCSHTYTHTQNPYKHMHALAEVGSANVEADGVSIAVRICEKESW